MAIHYEITRRWSPFCDAAAFHRVTRKDVAANRLWSEIYAMLEGNGLLDRPIAHKLLAQFNACEVSPPPLGYKRFEVFRLNDFASVTFSAMRV